MGEVGSEMYFKGRLLAAPARLLVYVRMLVTANATATIHPVIYPHIDDLTPNVWVVLWTCIHIRRGEKVRNFFIPQYRYTNTSIYHFVE